MPPTPADDLARWIPRLLATWRAARKAPPPGWTGPLDVAQDGTVIEVPLPE